jgi:tight adherence protein C
MRVPAPGALRRCTHRPADAGLIAAAGLEGRLGPADMAAARAGCAVAAAVVTAPLLIAGPLASVVLAVAVGTAALAPGRWLGTRASRRRAALVRELPDLMDLLGICVEAGMALDPALGLSAERLGGTVGEEVGRLLGDLRFGMPRAAAYRAMVERMEVPELTQAVAALLQADELGTPLSGALAGQAAALRSSRRQAARDRAAKAAPKIQLVVALLMVPAVLILVLGVLIIELSRQVGAVVGG